jgi:hypothetical protein
VELDACYSFAITPALVRLAWCGSGVAMKVSRLRAIRLKVRAAQETCKTLRTWLIANLGEGNSGLAALTRLEHELLWLEQKARDWTIGYPRGRSRISADKIEAIRQWRWTPKPKESVTALAKRLGVSRQTIYSIRDRT